MKRVLLILSLFLTTCAQAEVRLPGWMTSNMVLQQKATLHLNAMSKPKGKVKITTSWNKEVMETHADKDGKFSIDIAIPEAGGPYTLTFNDGQETILNNVMLGEVWFCSGQSNMEMPIKGWGKVHNFEQEIANAQHPLIRLFQVKQVTAYTPQTEVPLGYTNGWVECSPETIEEFSATAYFFARTVSKRLGVAVGVVNSSWGGTPAETWTSHETLKQVSGFENMLSRLEDINFDANKIQDLYEQEHKAWQEKLLLLDKGLLGGNINSPQWNDTENEWNTISLPSHWESAGLSNFDGVVWFRRIVDIPVSMEGKDLNLKLGMIDDEDKTYWNGELVAEGWGYNQPRHYIVPGRLVKRGRNVILVRVTDTGGEGGMAGPPSEMNINNNLPLAGLWQYRIGVSMAQLPQPPANPSSSWWPSSCYNAMVAPFLDMPIQGFLWYQGCANVGRAEQYEGLFQALIHDWKHRFGQHPFYFVQLANYLTRQPLQPDSPWAALREAQSKALQIDGTGMMVNIDLGEANDIHPKNKQEVGRRLARLALNRTYGLPLSGCAPEYSHMTVKGNRAIISFSIPPGAEPITNDSDVKGFTLAGPDKKWHIAQARTLSGNCVEVSSPEVAVPVAVRYGWADNPECTLSTPEGFHVSPFRTDKW